MKSMKFFFRTAGTKSSSILLIAIVIVYLVTNTPRLLLNLAEYLRQVDIVIVIVIVCYCYCNCDCLLGLQHTLTSTQSSRVPHTTSPNEIFGRIISQNLTQEELSSWFVDCLNSDNWEHWTLNLWNFNEFNL